MVCRYFGWLSDRLHDWRYSNGYRSCLRCDRIEKSRKVKVWLPTFLGRIEEYVVEKWDRVDEIPDEITNL